MKNKKIIAYIGIGICAIFAIVLIIVNAVYASRFGSPYAQFGYFSELWGYDLGLATFCIVLGFIQALLFAGLGFIIYSRMLKNANYKNLAVWGFVFASLSLIFCILHFIPGLIGNAVVSIFGIIVGGALGVYAHIQKSIAST